jgi:mono/diheme cytochrome c family protein
MLASAVAVRDPKIVRTRDTENEHGMRAERTSRDGGTTRRNDWVAFALFLLASTFFPVSTRLSAQSARDDELSTRFIAEIRPLLATYCQSCHGADDPEAEFDLSSWATAVPTAIDHERLELVLERLQAGEMPPAKSKRQPNPDDRNLITTWIRDFRTHEANRNAGDPGPVLPRRLNSSEYDYSIRDLTGADIRPAREFPVDPANQAGFDNSGESLTMSPALIEKYLDAARLVADHVLFLPNGLSFAPHPVVADTDRDKYCVQRIVDFYDRHAVDVADYFCAAWRYRYRRELGSPNSTLDDAAVAAGLSPRYLATMATLLRLDALAADAKRSEDRALAEDSERVDPIASIAVRWNDLPRPPFESMDAAVERARILCSALRDDVMQLRGQLGPRARKIGVRGISDGSQPLVLWMNRRRAEYRLRLPPLEERSTQAPIESSLIRAGEAERPGFEESIQRFAAAFPDAFFVSKRGHYSDADLGKDVRLLSAGFHLMHGHFRDDAPLYTLVLDDDERREIDRLWTELDVVTASPMRQYKDFVFFERAEPPRFLQSADFDFARSEDKDVTSADKIERLREGYLARARGRNASEEALDAISTYFTDIASAVRRVEAGRLAAEPSHIEALESFATRAFRRPLSLAEAGDLRDFYRSLRDGGAAHDEAVRDVVVSILMSPRFLYRADLEVDQETDAPNGTTPDNIVSLSTSALASRLSYFLWSSLPDDELLARAAKGELADPEVLVAETRRMLRDPRSRRFALEFGGQWLDIRRFEEHQSVDRERFPAFTDELRRSMLEEPIRCIVDLIERDGSILELLYGKHTFVDRALADHYGIAWATTDSSGRGPVEWQRIDDARRFGRGGLLPMAVFLTKNSPGLRTSPVKRGYWVVRRLLGERIPAPPPQVPELPRDEAKLGSLTLREVLERHRADPSCAGCHERFDGIGIAFEGYGPIGERRELDLGGRGVDTNAVFPGGAEGAGLDGLLDYLRLHRESEFIDTLCRKALAYALGRTLILSDEPLIEEMKASLAREGQRIGVIFEAIVRSRQFQTKRGRRFSDQLESKEPATDAERTLDR